MSVSAQLRTPGPLRTLALATVVNNTGNGAFAATAVVYLNQLQHISGSVIGFGFTAAAIAAMLASVPAGILADRRNVATQSGLLSVAAGIASGLYALVTGIWSFAVVAVVYAVLERGSSVARQTLIGTVFTGAERTAARAVLRSVSNVGTAIGTGVAALVLGIGQANTYRLLFIGNALSYALAGFLMSRIVLENRRRHAVTAGSAADRPAPRTAVLRDHQYAVASAVNALLTVHIVVLEVVLPLWVINRTEAPRTIIALLLLANTALVILFQLPVSRPFDTVAKAVGGLRVAALLLSAMFLLLALSTSVEAVGAIALLVGATGAQTGAEMVQGAASWPLSYDLAPAGRVGEYLGFFSLTEQLVQMIGPAGLTLLLIDWSGPGAAILAATYAVIALAAPPVVRARLAHRASASSTQSAI